MRIRPAELGRINWLAALAAMLVSSVALAVPPGVRTLSHYDHDDHGSSLPPGQGTLFAGCRDGVSAGFSCRNVELLSRLPLDQMGDGSGSDSWGWKDEQTGRYYALVGRSNGTGFVDVSDPENPVFVGNLPSDGEDVPWRDLKTYADHVFIVADDEGGGGVQIFDLTRLRSAVPPEQFSADAHYDGIVFAHNIAINEESGFAYVVGSDQCEGGLHMVDIHSPLQPVFAGCFSGDGYTHDAQCINYHGPDADYQGAEICFASNEDSLTIVDVSDKGNPRLVSKAVYPQVGFSHQGWLTEDQGVFFMGDELDEQTYGNNTRTIAFDVRDLDAPKYGGAFLHSTPAIDHNLYVHGGFLFEANYLAGLRILRIDHALDAELTEIAYFDTSPLFDVRDFGGAWNVYAFFDNGVLLVSDIEAGLFVLRASLADQQAELSSFNGRLSGLWVADELQDQGLTLIVGENRFGPYVYFAWLIYEQGAAIWIAGDAPFEYGVDEVSVPAQRLEGLESIQAGPEQALRHDIGSVTLHVHSCRELHVDYMLDGLGSGELDLHRLATVQGRECLDDSED